MHGRSGHLPRRAPVIHNGPAADKLPDELIEAAILLSNFQECPGIDNGRLDFRAVAHDGWIVQQRADFIFAVARNFFGIEIIEGLAERFALFQDGEPAQARLRAFENQEFK